jgi:hypothetical protein
LFNLEWLITLTGNKQTTKVLLKPFSIAHILINNFCFSCSKFTLKYGLSKNPTHTRPPLNPTSRAAITHAQGAIFQIQKQPTKKPDKAIQTNGFESENTFVSPDYKLDNDLVSPS